MPEFSLAFQVVEISKQEIFRMAFFEHIPYQGK